MKVGALVGSPTHACYLEPSVDFLIAQGYDAGGHTGPIGTLSLIPQVVDAVKVPILAAGGIADGRGFVAALALGASGILVGSILIGAIEAGSHIKWKEKLAEATATDSIITKCWTGKTARCLKNRGTKEWAKRENEIMGFPYQMIKSDLACGWDEGDTENCIFPMGQGVGLVNEVNRSAADIVAELVNGAEKVLRQMDKLAIKT